MLYQIGNKYYVKVGQCFVEVELVYKDNDVDLKPTNKSMEITKDMQYTEVNFMNIKSELLEKKKSRIQKESIDEFGEKPKKTSKFSNKYSFDR